MRAPASVSHSDQADEVVAECSKVCPRKPCTEAVGRARRSSGVQAGSLLSVISFADLSLAFACSGISLIDLTAFLRASPGTVTSRRASGGVSRSLNLTHAN